MLSKLPMQILFFTFLLFSVFSYVLFPGLLWVVKTLFARPWKKSPNALSVSMIISVYNEEAVIREKIENALSLDYPADLLEVVVCSDGSTDKTHEIVRAFNDSRLSLIKFDRLGKTECLNRAVPMAKGDIILFTDANSMFPPDLVRQLSANFSDPDVGLTTGWTKYMKVGGEDDVTGAYARLEKLTKYWESLVSSCVGADGAVFAIRKSLYRPLAPGDINDFIIPLNVIGQARRAVLDPDAWCREEAADSGEKAYHRQVRITTRTLWAIRHNFRFLNVMKYGWFSFFLISHKVLRLAVPFFFISGFFLNIGLIGQWWLYDTIFAAYLIFIGLGLLGISGISRGSMASMCMIFLITFSAQLAGWLRMMIGIKDITWLPRR
jgi:cellulose synthase/poly-beta-1,6-N-acetylglucosamine synthase-like glycosyltransferase